MIRTQIQLTEEQSHILKRISALKKISIAELIRQGIDFYLRSTTTISPDKRKQRALSVVGKYKSNLSDLSSKHDDYFVEDLS